MRSFLGLCMYYRRFISGYEDIAKPLTRLTEEKWTFKWSTEAETAFQALKEAVCTAPLLGYSRPGEKFFFDTYTNNVGIGGVLSQVQDGNKRVVAYFSKTLSKAQRIYCATRRELMAIVKTLEHFHKYLYGQEFHSRSDHSAVTWLLSFRNLEGQTARWVQRLQEYNFTSKPPSRHQAHQRRRPFKVPCPEECSHCQKVEQWADGQRA